MERLASLGQLPPPRLRELEQALDAALDQPRTAVTADLWDVERLASCVSCRDQRIERLRRINLCGVREPPISCAECDSEWPSDTRSWSWGAASPARSWRACSLCWATTCCSSSAARIHDSPSVNRRRRWRISRSSGLRGAK